MPHRCCSPRILAIMLALLAPTAGAPAGGTAENAVILIDPENAASLYIGHYYRAARDIPSSNVIYMDPQPGTGFDEFADVRVQQLLGSLVNHGIDDHVDYVIIPPNGRYRFDAPGLVSDPCPAPMTRFSQAGAYCLAFITEEIRSQTLDALETNRYFTSTIEARGFDSSTAYLSGAPSESASARRYFIGGMIGYDGLRGNTLEEMIALIDRSVAADATFPSGTIYYVETTDIARSGPRDHLFPRLVSDIMSLGGDATHLSPVPSTDLNVIADGNQDCLGIMTGWPTPDIDGANITVVPGAFCDHLTSFAATFSNGSQTKLSEWITIGASGSAGAVEEPCAVQGIPGKFPHPNYHAFYLQGMSLGEAWFRSTEWIPFQILLYGDPLTRPFTHIPDVDITVPTTPVSGTIMLTPSATTTHPTASIDELELLVDGVSFGTVPDGGSFSLDTTLLADGHHDLRVLAYDDTLVRSVGRVVEKLDVDNQGLSASLSVDVDTGDPATAFTFTVGAAGGALDQIHLIEGSRIVASAFTPSSFMVFGRNLGAGPVQVRAKAIFDDGSMAMSPPVDLDITFSEAAAPGGPPKAFSYTAKVRRDQPRILVLPVAHNHEYNDVDYLVTTAPTQSTVDPIPVGPSRLLFPDPAAIGTDTLEFEVSTPGGDDTATIDIIYGGPVANDECAAATLALSGDVSFTTVDATTDGPDESATCGGSDAENDVWYRHFAICSGVVTFTLSDLDYSATLAVYEGLTCPTDPEAVACAQTPDQTSVTLSAEPGSAFLVRIGGMDGAKGSGTLSIVCSSCPADCAPKGGDGTVDTVDLLALLAGWGMTGQACNIAGDDVVDVQDLLLMLSEWGECD